MEMKDVIQLGRWLNGGASLEEVLETQRFGLVDNERFTPQAVRAYTLIWEWSCDRFGGEIGMRQLRVYEKMGGEFLKRRFARCQRIAARLGMPLRNAA